MKNIKKLQEDVSTIEKFAINNLVVLTVINLGTNSKTPILKDGYKTGMYIEVTEKGEVLVVSTIGNLEATKPLKEYSLSEIINLLNSLNATQPV